MKAKSTFTQAILVKNWLSENQRFGVKWTVENEDPGLFINGANTIDLVANSSKEYKINFYSLKPIVQKLNVYFRNQDTNEYIFYKINLTIQPADIQGKLEMISVVRESCMKLITIENLLSK
jgi:hydrocephalus-inducing protein